MRRTLTMVTGEHLPHSGQLSFSLRCQICNNTHHTCLPMVLMCSCVYVYVCVCVPCVFTTRSVLLITGRINTGSRTVAPLTVFFFFPPLLCLSCRISLCSGIPAVLVLPACHSYTLVPHVLWTGSSSIQLW